LKLILPGYTLGNELILPGYTLGNKLILAGYTLGNKLILAGYILGNKRIRRSINFDVLISGMLFSDEEDEYLYL
jgi:hypothetical protein